MSRTSSHAGAPRANCSIESLEGRCLLSATAESAAGAEAAVSPPVVRMLGRHLVTGGTHYAFRLVVRSGGGTTPPLDGDDVVLRGPNGYAAAAEVTLTTSGAAVAVYSCRVAAPGGRFDRADKGLYTLSLRQSEVGPAAFSSGSHLGRFRVQSSATPDARPALPLSERATAGALSVTFDEVYAWCDHMPWVGPEPSREYLVLRTTLENTSDRPLEVTLSRAFISFDENQLGEETQGISIRLPTGRPSGEKTLVLQPGETRVVQYRGNGVYPEDRHGQRMYVTLEFTADGATAAVRNSGVVMVTH